MAATTTAAVAPTSVVRQRRSDFIGTAELFLRSSLLVMSVIALAVITTSKQTKMVPVVVPGVSVPVLVPLKAKFYYLPQIVYLVVALCVVVIYSTITTLVSLATFMKYKPTLTSKLPIYIVILDVLLLGVTASAGGAASGVSYVGFKGNSHTGWQKLCHITSKFCLQAGSAIVISLLGSMVQVLLITLYVISQHRKIPNKVHWQQNDL